MVSDLVGVLFCAVILCHSNRIQLLCLGRAVFHDCGLSWVFIPLWPIESAGILITGLIYTFYGI